MVSSAANPLFYDTFDQIMRIRNDTTDIPSGGILGGLRSEYLILNMKMQIVAKQKLLTMIYH